MKLDIVHAIGSKYKFTIGIESIYIQTWFIFHCYSLLPRFWVPTNWQINGFRVPKMYIVHLWGSRVKTILKGCWWIQVNQQKSKLQGPGFLIVTLTVNLYNQIGESRIRFFLIFLVELQFFFTQQGGGKNSGSPTCDQLVPFSAGFIKLPKFGYPSRSGHSNGLSYGGYSLRQNKWPKIHRELGFHPWNKWSYGPLLTYDWFGGPPCKRNALSGEGETSETSHVLTKYSLIQITRRTSRYTPTYPTSDQRIKPTGSMYGIFTYIWLKFKVNVGKYTIHGSNGKEEGLPSTDCQSYILFKYTS